LSAGRRIKDILQMVPFTEEEVRRKSETLRPPDGQFSLPTVVPSRDSLTINTVVSLPQMTAG